MAVPTVAWSESLPAGSENVSTGDDRIREMKKQVREIIAVDHEMTSTQTASTGGEHKKVTLQDTTDLGTGATGKCFVGAQGAEGSAELTFTDEDDNDVVLTVGGAIAVLGTQAWRTGDYLFSAAGATPTGWTDKSTTKANMFIRVAATASETAATFPTMAHVHDLNSHTHTGPSHNHELIVNVTSGGRSSLETVDGGDAASTAYSNAAGTGASGAASGNTASTGTTVQYIAMNLYYKD